MTVKPTTALALAVITATAAAAGVQTLRLQDARQQTAQALATLATERASHERQARTVSEKFRNLEGTHREELARIDTQAHGAIAAAAADADRARAAGQRLRGELADYLDRHRTAALARAAAGHCAPDPAPAQLLAELQQRTDDRAGELAAIADDARERGSACERAYNSARAMTEAARNVEAAKPAPAH